MDQKMFQHFFELPVNRPELPANKRSLYQLLASAVTTITVFQFLTGIGIFVISMLGLTGYLDKPENIGLLFLVSSINILDSILHIPMVPLLRHGKLEMVAVLLILTNGTLAAIQILLWQGITWFPLLLILSAIIILDISYGLSSRSKILIVAIGMAQLTAILIVDKQITYPRLSLSNLNNSAGLIVYLLFAVAMLTIGVMNGMVNFKTLSRRLTAIFTTTTVITIIIFIVAGTLVNYLDSRKRAFEQLESISNLKADQIKLTLERLQKQAGLPLSNTSIYKVTVNILTDDINGAFNKINTNLVRFYLRRLQTQATGNEYLLVNAKGRIIISTNPAYENLEVSTFHFMEDAQQNMPFAIEKDFPGSPGKYSLLVLNPLRVENRIVGVLVLLTDFSSINDITVINPGVKKTFETYLISQIAGISVPTTTTRAEIDEIATYPIEQVLSFGVLEGSSTYTNYANADVVGHFVWIPELQSILISEVEQQEIFSEITNSLPVYFSMGLIIILLVFATIFLASQNISLPFQDFTQKAAALAGGSFSIRISTERQDEIGALAFSFNQMAQELENIVRTLETKVEERTKDLQKQANYLRIAAEVARDATTSQDLDELLNRAAQLILDRFDFYHTGIFLIDSDREFAVLRASPTEAGRKMLEQGHRLRLGQVGIVGYVAATGTPRIALDIGQDVTYFNNPLLPNTHSEIAIPLNLDDRVLGVLDVQSTRPEAFTQDDVATLQVMADQLALAIQRIELVNNLQRNLEELENTYKTFTRESWEKFSQESEFKPGYLFDGFKITPLESWPESTRNTLAKGRTTIIPPQRETDGATIITPLKLREQVIGGLTIRFQTQAVDQDTISLLEETAARLAVALENARLYAETQNLVQREHAISEISSRITTSFNIENILRTTVMEIGKRMPDAEVIVQLEQNKD